MSMISSFCRPSNRPPSFEESPKPSKEVSFANSSAANHESPRSCTNMNIFVSTIESKVGTNEEAATAADPASQDDDTYTEETPAEVAMLLASVADIATKEIKADPPVMSELADAFPRFPDLSSESVENTNHGNSMMDYQVISEEQQQQAPSEVPTLMHFDHNEHYTQGHKTRERAVSMDCPEFLRPEFLGEPLDAPPSSPPHEEEAIPTLLQWRNLRGEATTPPHHHSIFSTPPASPLVTSSHRRPRAYSTSGYHHTTHRTPKRSPRVGRPRSVSLAEGITAASAVANSSIEQVPVLDLTAPEHQVNENKPKKLILRKKFSWKNYPELEEFLIANREEYLRHSTLNYTQMQKKYNNCLTERMIKLAAEHGYMFDESEFSFVTVRDRIRCYYKSYVQSMKKRGVVIGYAARKAGLVSEEQLEESAHTSGKIYVPKN